VSDLKPTTKAERLEWTSRSIHQRHDLNEEDRDLFIDRLCADLDRSEKQYCSAYMKSANAEWTCAFLTGHEGLHYDDKLCFEWGQEAGEPPSEPPSLLTRGKRLLRVLDGLRDAGRELSGIKKLIHALGGRMNKDEFDAFEALIGE